jgi:hypothetical protein
MGRKTRKYASGDGIAGVVDDLEGRSDFSGAAKLGPNRAANVTWISLKDKS